VNKFLAVSVVALSLPCSIFAQAASSGSRSCESLSQWKIDGAKVASAETVVVGAFSPPPNSTPWLAGDPAFYKTLPSFCRLVIDAVPSSDSDIKIEVWMPVSGWNGKFQGQANGGFAGELDYHHLGVSLQKGYATAATDTGHSAGGTNASWALGHPEKVKDFGYRAIHEMTRIAQAAVKEYYGSAVQRSYFDGCSNGGRQALMEVQRFPQDYDGVIAGAPANFWTHMLVKSLADAQATGTDPAAYIPASKIPALAQAVNSACDAQDGVADGILNDPRKCRFDPAVLLCKDSDSDKCLTQPQIATLKELYQGPKDSHGDLIYPGYLPGAEEGPGGWGIWITGSAPGKSLIYAFSTGYFTNFVYENANWNYKEARIDDALKAAEEKSTQDLNATESNLAPFSARGGKLVLYHGWNDPAISALNTINYYESVVRRMGAEKTADFLRVYMVPGMQHCAGGPGPFAIGQGGMGANDSKHNIEVALEQWVEKGAAPADLLATKFVDDNPAKGVKLTRPLCAYPQTAKYKGTGDTNDAANFTCAPAN